MEYFNNEDDYERDSRSPCQYGEKCYRKNPDHLSEYKHRRIREQKQEAVIPPAKKRKISDFFIKKPLKPQGDGKNDHGESSKEKLKDADVAFHKKREIDSKPSSPQKQILTTKNDTPNEIVSPMKQFSPGSPKKKITDKESGNSKHVDSQIEKLELRAIDFNITDADKQFIKEKFLVSMPDDFYAFWHFCKSINKSNPQQALEGIIELLLVGPFDVLAKKFENVNKSDEEYLRHWRYYYDPPEFQTVIKGDDKTGYHMGYFRDSPDQLPVFVASNHALKDGVVTVMAENIFGAVFAYTKSYLKTCNPFNKTKVSHFLTQIENWSKAHNITLQGISPAMKSRSSKIVAKTFNKAGIVVPYNRKTQLGYRPLIETNAEIKNILTKIINADNDKDKDVYLSKLQPVITMASIALDECDFGTGLELGLNLFAFGGEVFHNTILSLLSPAYSLLGRHDYNVIIQAHLKDRKKGVQLSIL